MLSEIVFPHPLLQIRLFMARNPLLSLHKPESLSTARIQGFTEENIKTIFDLLKPKLKKINFKPNKIFNVHETRKILTVKGKREVHKLSSAEKGHW